MRIKKRTILLLLLSLLIIPVLHLGAGDLSMTGLSQTKAAVTFEDASIPYWEQKVDLNLDVWGNMSHLFIQPYLSVGADEAIEFNMRELYGELYFDAMDIRIGKQIVATGQADGLYLTNMISPKNMSDFLLSETHELQTGVPAVKADYYLDAFTLSGIWIASHVPTETFSSDSLWYRTPELFSQGTVTVLDPELPETSLENSEIFGKVSYFGSTINGEIMGGYTWTDEPYSSGITITSPLPALAADVDTEYGRYAVAGGSLSLPVSSAVVRGETLVSFNKPMSSVQTAPAPSVSVEEHTVVDALIGVDLNAADMMLSAQYRLTYITDFNDSLIVNGKATEEAAHMVTFHAQKNFLDDTLTADLFTAMELNTFNALIRPSLTYAIEDAVEVTGEALIFVGDESGMYGTYNDSSLLSLALNYYF